jgi:hypothetical protein
MKLLRYLLFLLFPACCFGQGIIYQLSPPAPNAQVRFCPVPDAGYPCPVLTTVYSDSAATQVVAQPITLGSGGNLTVYFAANTTSATVQLSGPGYGPNNRTVISLGGGGGITSVATLPATCTPGVTAPVQLSVAPYGIFYCSATNTWTASASGTILNVLPAGLLAELRFLPTETPASCVDYSGAGNGCTGSAGTTPTIIAGSGGISCTGNGALTLPAALNGVKTIVAYIGFQYLTNTSANSNTIIGGSAGYATSLNWLLYEANLADSWGNANQGGYRMRTQGTSSSTYLSSSSGAFNGNAVVALVLSNPDVFYTNGIANPVAQTGNSIGQQSSGVLQICGSATPGYFNGNIYYLAAWSTALNASQIAQATQVMTNAMTARGVTAFLGAPNTDSNDQITLIGDSLTSGINWPTASVAGQPMSIADEGWPAYQTGTILAGQTQLADTLYHPGALRNPLMYWAGTNDGSNAPAVSARMRSFLLARRVVGFKTIVATMISRTGSDAFKDLLNPFTLQYWPTFADGMLSLNANVNIGADGANTNTTYFNADKIHLTTYADNYIVGPYFIHAINRVYGNTLQGANYNRYLATGFSIPTPAQTADNGCTGKTGASVTCVIPFNSTAGSMLYVITTCFGCGSSTINVPSDSQVNSFSAVSAQGTMGNANFVMRAAYALNTTGGADTITQTFTGGTPTAINIKVVEFKNVATAAALDVNSVIASGNSTAPASANVTTTQTGDLLVCAGGSQGGAIPLLNTFWLPGAGYAQLTSDPSTFVSYQIAGAAGSYPCSATIPSNTWGMQLAAFKAVAGASVYKLQDVDIYSDCVPSATGNVGLVLPDGAWMAGQSITIHNEQTTGSNTCTVNNVTPYETGVTQNIDGAASLIIPNQGTVELKSLLTYTGVAGTNQSPVINWTQVKSNGLQGTNTNCSSSGGTCGSASAGSVSIAAAATTVTVATTAVTANSQITITEDSSLGTKLGVTCNTTTGRTYTVTTRTAATSFAITASAAPSTNPACLSYTVVN